MKKPWTISAEKRVRLEAALAIIAKDHCDYINGKKAKRDYPFNLTVKK